MNSNRKQVRNPFIDRIRIIELAVKELPSAKLYAILLLSIMLVGIFSLSTAISTLIKDVVISSNGRIATETTAPIAYKSEIRGVFVHCATFGWDHDWDVIAQTCKDYKINAVFAEVVSTQSAYYPSDYLPWVVSRDEIAEGIAACHDPSRNIKFFVNMDVLYYPGSSDIMLETQTGSLVNSGTCPTKLASRTLIKNVVEEIATNYDIDGFTYDYARYPTGHTDVCYCSECRVKFEEWLDEGTIMDWTQFYPGGSRYNEFMEWRVVPITELVGDIHTWMTAIKPDLEFRVAAWTLFGETGAPTYWRYYLGQDTADWVNKGYVDLCGAMMYTTVLIGYPDSIQAYVEADYEYFVGGPEGKVPLVATITTGVGDPVDPIAFKAVVDYLRELGVDGWIIWRYGGPGCVTTPDITDYLRLLDLPDTFSISNIDVTTDGTSATITWTTDLAATSKVEYSTSPLFNATKGSLYDFDYWDVDHVHGTIVEDEATVTEHSITLTDLLLGTKYYFRVQSEDGSGIATSKVLTFTTG